MRCNKNKVPMVRLGDYIKEVDERNADGIDYEFYGINKSKDFMPSVADTDGVDKTKYKIVRSGVFVFSGMQTGRDVCIRIALYNRATPCLISPAYTTFIINGGEKLCPEYVFLYFNRFEMDRYGAFLSDGSIRSNLDWDRFCDIQIPLPDIEVQKSVVAAYKGLKNLIETNEALIEPLQNACNAYVVDLKKKYPMKALGPYIQECDERNRDGKIKLSQGISNEKYFQEPKQVAENSQSDRIVRKGQFAYNRATTRNGEKISIALREGPDCTVSSAYGVFKVIDEKVLMSEYLLLFFKRSEFDRYARYMSKGSAHEFFEMDEMQRVQIPLPPIEIQKAIVAVYKGLAEAKRIASEAKEELKKICPALVQMAAHSA